MLNKLKKLYLQLMTIEKRNHIQSKCLYYTDCALNSNKVGINLEENNIKKIIVSLTTYSRRIDEVYLTIESLFNQTKKADKIILWLDENEYIDGTIPLILKKQIKRGLEIKYYRNIKSYKKLIPTLKLFPKDIIITIDDDVLYPYDFIEKLYSEHQKNPLTILCNIGRLIPKDKKFQKNYKNWKYSTIVGEPRFDIVPIGVGGILYPPDCFSSEVLDEELFMQLAPNADDIWFKGMALKNDIKSMVIGNIAHYLNKLIVLENNQDMALFNKNIIENDPQIHSVFNKYNLWQKLEK